MTHPVPQRYRHYRLVLRLLLDGGYSKPEIADGFEYADAIGWSDTDRLGQLTLSRILYTDAQLADDELVGWEPVDWTVYED